MLMMRRQSPNLAMPPPLIKSALPPLVPYYWFSVFLTCPDKEIPEVPDALNPAVKLQLRKVASSRQSLSTFTRESVADPQSRRA